MENDDKRRNSWQNQQKKGEIKDQKKKQREYLSSKIHEKYDRKRIEIINKKLIKESKEKSWNKLTKLHKDNYKLFFSTSKQNEKSNEKYAKECKRQERKSTYERRNYEQMERTRTKRKLNRIQRNGKYIRNQ